MKLYFCTFIVITNVTMLWIQYKQKKRPNYPSFCLTLTDCTNLFKCLQIRRFLGSNLFYLMHLGYLWLFMSFILLWCEIIVLIFLNLLRHVSWGQDLCFINCTKIKAETHWEKLHQGSPVSKLNIIAFMLLFIVLIVQCFCSDASVFQ